MWRETVLKRLEKIRNKKKLSENDFKEIEAATRILNQTGYFYDAVIAFMKLYNIKEVVDIGCAYGFQAEAFLQEGLSYIGIEKAPCLKHKAGEVKYIQGTYPFVLGDYHLGVLSNCMHKGFYPYKALSFNFKIVLTDKIINKTEAEKYFTINKTFLDVNERKVQMYILTRI